MGIYPNVGNKVYYVSTLGTDNTDTGRGTSPELLGEQLNMLVLN